MLYQEIENEENKSLQKLKYTYEQWLIIIVCNNVSSNDKLHKIQWYHNNSLSLVTLPKTLFTCFGENGINKLSENRTYTDMCST